MAELQAEAKKYTIRRRNELAAKRHATLDSFRRLHAEEGGANSARVAHQVAAQIVTDFKAREASRGVPNVSLVSAAIEARKELTDAYQERSALEELVGCAYGKASQELETARHPDEEAIELCFAELDRRIATANQKLARLAEKLEVLEVQFRSRAHAAGCNAHIYSRELDDILELARRGERRLPAEEWDVSTEVFRRFGWTIGPDGVIDERITLDAPDDALAYTLFLRAVLSKDPDDDLISRAIHEAEGDELVARRAPPGDFKGLSVPAFAELVPRAVSSCPVRGVCHRSRWHGAATLED
jgi:hypothetical protein